VTQRVNSQSSKLGSLAINCDW